jgi:hypothetical protein
VISLREDRIEYRAANRLRFCSSLSASDFLLDFPELIRRRFVSTATSSNAALTVITSTTTTHSVKNVSIAVGSMMIPS